jgi:hypothetical protein
MLVSTSAIGMGTNIFGDCLFTHRVITNYMPNLRIYVKMYVVPQYSPFSATMSIIVFQQEWIMVSSSALGT